MLALDVHLHRLPKADVDELKALVEEAEAWTEKKVAEQAKKSPSDVPAYTSSEMFDKLRPIAR
jgi:predicted transcriptional regulator